MPASAGSADEQAVARSIAGELKQSGQLTQYNVGVKYQDGVAWLLGTVTSQDQANKAVALAQRVSGVDKVISKLEIVGAENPVAKTAADSGRNLSQPTEESGSLLLSLGDDRQASTPARQASLEQPAQPMAMQQPPQLQRVPMQQSAQMPMPHQMSRQAMPRPQQMARRTMPMPMARTAPNGGGVQQAQACMDGGYAGGAPQGYAAGGGGGGYENPQMPGYAWPSYAAQGNYAALSYPKQYSPTAWPYIGPFYPYPQVPLGWRKVELEWDDGWWYLDFSHGKAH
ncbi:BON domain-containing protein [Pirellulimonas nuda]|nr:BON domain-containing protein [Pirellulimonas nuda]